MNTKSKRNTGTLMIFSMVQGDKGVLLMAQPELQGEFSTTKEAVRHVETCVGEDPSMAGSYVVTRVLKTVEVQTEVKVTSKESDGLTLQEEDAEEEDDRFTVDGQTTDAYYEREDDGATGREEREQIESARV